MMTTKWWWGSIGRRPMLGTVVETDETMTGSDYVKIVLVKFRIRKW